MYKPEELMDKQKDSNENDDKDDENACKQIHNSLGWAKPFFENYTPGDYRSSTKMTVLIHILLSSKSLNERVTIFSQSIPTLNWIENFLNNHNRKYTAKNKQMKYLRIDGSTDSKVRADNIRSFNDLKNDILVMLVSTKAGSEGINLIGGNRVILFDVSWNPCHDHQAMCRSHRLGQRKKVFVYRLISCDSLEKKIFDLQLHKEGMSKRIIDDKAIERRLTRDDLEDIFDVSHDKDPVVELDKVDTLDDKILATIITKYPDYIQACYPQETVMKPEDNEKLTDEERKETVKEYIKKEEMIQKELENEVIKVTCSKCMKEFPLSALFDGIHLVTCEKCGKQFDLSKEDKGKLQNVLISLLSYYYYYYII